MSYFKTETEENIYFILKVAQVLRGIFYICAAIIIVSTFFIFGFDDETFAGILLGCIFAFIGFLITPFLEWKAYMLKNIYEIRCNKKN